LSLLFVFAFLVAIPEGGRAVVLAVLLLGIRARLSPFQASRETATYDRINQEAKQLILLPLLSLLIFFCRFLPKNRMSSPETSQLPKNQVHPRGILVPPTPL
jgi:hypothetical protein